MLFVLSALMISGLLLYYGSEEMRDGVQWTHWIVGFASIAVFLLHLVIGKRAQFKNYDVNKIST